MADEELVYVGIKGKVAALSRATGEMRWSADLTGGWLTGGFVHLVVDGDCVFATTQGEVICLDSATGGVRWHNVLRGYGIGIASIATKSSSSPADLAAQINAQQQSAAASSAAQ